MRRIGAGVVVHALGVLLRTAQLTQGIYVGKNDFRREGRFTFIGRACGVKGGNGLFGESAFGVNQAGQIPFLRRFQGGAAEVLDGGAVLAFGAEAFETGFGLLTQGENTAAQEGEEENSTHGLRNNEVK